MEAKTQICCIECDHEFETSTKKVISEKFNCPKCGFKMQAEDDIDEEGNTFWYVIKARGEQ